MKKTVLLIIIGGSILYGANVLLCYNRNRKRYEETLQMLVGYADSKFSNSRKSHIPRLDAWGNSFAVKTNNFFIVYTSKGADLKNERDDVILMIDRGQTSYFVSYTYKSRHFSKGFFPEQNSMAAVSPNHKNCTNSTVRTEMYGTTKSKSFADATKLKSVTLMTNLIHDVCLYFRILIRHRKGQL